MARTARFADPVEAYARQVVEGDIVAGKLVRQACQRHLTDLVEGKKRKLKWDRDAALRAISFFSDCLMLSSAEWAGKPFDLLPWQQFVIGSIFGWKTNLGFRRFDTARIYIARKNGKTELAAGIALYCLLADGEPSAQVFAAATKREQAQILFSAAERMVRLSPFLSGRVSSKLNKLEDKTTFSTFVPLSRDAKKLDGLSPHCAVIDEIHEHPNSEIIDKLKTGTGARRQGLIVETTTAGSERESICYKNWMHSEKILNGTLPAEAADSTFCFIATLDEGDDWRDENTWGKANPSLDAIGTTDKLRAKAANAKSNPGEENTFRRYYMNEWTNSQTRAIDWALWDAGKETFDVDELEGRLCYGGLDLAAVQDLTSLCLLFPPVNPGERWKALWHNWCPEENIQKRSNRDKVPYELWARQGFLTPTPGNTTDFDFVLKDVVELSVRYKIRAIAYDRLFAHGGSSFLNDAANESLPMVEFGQGFFSMGPAWNEFYRMLLAGEVQHGGNPIATWASDSVEVASDPAGNLKPVKPDTKTSTFRIDPIVAMIMAVGMKLRMPPEKPVDSIYKTRGMLFI